jgi:hypothetical protein
MNPREVKPFSNASEACSWTANNCDICPGKSYCYAKKVIEFGFICGTITKKVAMKIGMESCVFYDNDPGANSYCTLNRKCDMFGKIKPKKVKERVLPGQAKLFEI